MLYSISSLIHLHALGGVGTYVEVCLPHDLCAVQQQH